MKNNKTAIIHPAIELKNVTIQLESDIILKNVNLSIPAGQVVVIIGPSGEGKSVLLKTMAGLIKPKTGQVLVEGEDWQSLESKEKQLLSQKIGVLFQKKALFDSMTASENIAFPMIELAHLDQKTIQQRIDYFLKAVDIEKARHLYPDQMSGGMQRRLGIARALALNPEIVFYDDPMAGLDPITSDRVAKLLLELHKANNSTVVAITSEMYQAYLMADRILMVVDQEVIDAGSPAQIKLHPDARIQQFINGQIHGPLTDGKQE